MLDLQEITKAYRGNDLADYLLHIMVPLLFYGYAKDFFPSGNLNAALMLLLRYAISLLAPIQIMLH